MRLRLQLLQLLRRIVRNVNIGIAAHLPLRHWKRGFRRTNPWRWLPKITEVELTCRMMMTTLIFHPWQKYSLHPCGILTHKLIPLVWSGDNRKRPPLL
ncbi:MRC1-like domain-containing protein [Histoplasma capsulatum var. duboisii H88]|uniref:MRC1-like domain-containing protein n=1 Tax=Ajellomyces capsulatus (strain H88) TaxID=544711 RepID=A0A8A1LT35_AJEC8|nr:MRC1-like domain-containing protein [Histoplasma capsulatum var. duboisii H88]